MRGHKSEVLHPNSTPVSEIMTRDVLCVSPKSSCEALIAMMMEHGFSGAPVIDDHQKIVGVASKTDLLRWAAGTPDSKQRNRMVEDIMTPVAFTVSETAMISEAAALMVFESAHRLPVVSRDEKVIGIVSSLDILRWIAENEGYLVSRAR
jgi:CBS-domain-containing membrane protein